jgi:hypothetical protein
MPPVNPKATSHIERELHKPVGSNLVDKTAAEAAPLKLPVRKRATRRILGFRRQTSTTRKQMAIGETATMAIGRKVIAIKEKTLTPRAGLANAGSKESEMAITALAKSAAASDLAKFKILPTMMEVRTSASPYGIIR